MGPSAFTRSLAARRLTSIRPDCRADAGGGKAGARRIAAPSRSSAGGGSLPPPAAMPAVRDVAADQGPAVPASVVFVRNREGFRPPGSSHAVAL
jgi:hypothetical protein